MRTTRGLIGHLHSRTRPRPLIRACACTLALDAASANLRSASCFSLHLCLAHLRCCNDTLRLCASCNQATAYSCKVWVCSQTLPISPASCNPPNWTNEGTKGHMNTFPAIFTSKCMAIPQHEVSIKGSSEVDTRREGGDEFLPTHTSWRICKAQFWNIQTWNCACLSNARTGYSMGEVRLLFKSQLGYELFGSSVCCCPRG
jgi:hypothetical protein